MEPLHFTGVDGTGALALPAVIEEEFAKDRWYARRIPGLRNDYLAFCQRQEAEVETATREVLSFYVRDMTSRPNPRGANIRVSMLALG